MHRKEIQKEQTGYILITQNGEIHARCVVNAAGVYADVFHNMVSENKIHITPRRGEYCRGYKHALAVFSRKLEDCLVNDTTSCPV